MTQLQFHDLPDGRKIAFRRTGMPSQILHGPTIIFLPGYMSDMEGGKAAALFEWAGQEGRDCLLLDYSGCGSSPGDFADGTLSRWRDEVLDIIHAQVSGHSQASGKIILVGSSMGGWLAGMIGIAAAPDFSDWGYDEGQKARLQRGETVFEDNPYGPEPTPMHAGFWHDAQANRMLTTDIAIHCPVRLLHGQTDADVPWQTSLELAQRLCSDDIQVTLVKAADHRMSRDADIALLLRTAALLVAAA